jgi:hypothetical protein
LAVFLLLRGIAARFTEERGMTAFSVDVSASVEGVWTNAFDVVSRRMRGYFARREPYQNALRYLRTLRCPLKRKNGWQMLQEAGESPPYAKLSVDSRASAVAVALQQGLVSLNPHHPKRFSEQRLPQNAKRAIYATFS